MSTAAVVIPDLSKLQNEANDCLVSVKKEYLCRNDAELERCMLMFRFIKARRKEVKAELDKPNGLEAQIKLLHKMHSDATTLRSKVLSPYDQAEKAIEDIMRPYTMQKQRAEDERRRLEQLKAQKEAEEEKELLRMMAEIEGRPEEAAIIEQLAPVAAVVKPQQVTPQVEGVGVRRPWTYKIVDESLIPREYLVIDYKKIGAEVRDKKDLCVIPGVQVFQDVSFTG